MKSIPIALGITICLLLLSPTETLAQQNTKPRTPKVTKGKTCHATPVQKAGTKDKKVTISFVSECDHDANPKLPTCTNGTPNKKLVSCSCKPEWDHEFCRFQEDPTCLHNCCRKKCSCKHTPPPDKLDRCPKA